MLCEGEYRRNKRELTEILPAPSIETFHTMTCRWGPFGHRASRCEGSFVTGVVDSSRIAFAQMIPGPIRWFQRFSEASVCPRPVSARAGVPMTTFKVPCPSCEAKVLIKNPNLIGAKVECPKCKYRFKVEEPKDQAPAESGNAAKDAKPASAATAKRGTAKG